MDDLRELYQATILDHNKSPRNFGAKPECSHRADGYNPICGDKLTVFLALGDGDRVEDVSFEGVGCAISTASASLMTAAVKSKAVTEAVELFEQFREMVTAEVDAPVDDQRLGKMAVFAGVREFPMRVKCATLAWHTLDAALGGREKSVSTE